MHHYQQQRTPHSCHNRHPSTSVFSSSSKSSSSPNSYTTSLLSFSLTICLINTLYWTFFFISFRLGNVVVERLFFLFFLCWFQFVFVCWPFIGLPPSLAPASSATLFSTLASFGVVSVIVVVVVVVLTFKSILIKFFPAIFQFDVFPFLLFILSLIFGINSDDAPLPYCHFISPFWHLYFVWPLSWYFFALIDSCVWLGLPCSLDSVVFYTDFQCHYIQNHLSYRYVWHKRHLLMKGVSERLPF